MPILHGNIFYCTSEVIKVFNLIRMKCAWCHHLQGYCHFSAVRKLGQHTAIWQNITHYTPFRRCINNQSNHFPFFVWVWLHIHLLFCWSHQKRSLLPYMYIIMTLSHSASNAYTCICVIIPFATSLAKDKSMITDSGINESKQQSPVLRSDHLVWIAKTLNSPYSNHLVSHPAT